MVAPQQRTMLADRGRRACSFIELIGWKDAFWVASGVPALVLFSIGGIAATVGHALGPGVDAVGPVRLHPGLHLCRDRRAVPEQIGRRLGLWRGRLGALLEVHRAAFGVVQLACLDAGARNRLRHRRGLHPECAVPAGGGDPHLGDPAARSRLPQGESEAQAQLDLLHRRHPDRHLLRHPASRHSLDGARCRPSSASRCFCRCSSSASCR